MVCSPPLFCFVSACSLSPAACKEEMLPYMYCPLFHLLVVKPCACVHVCVCLLPVCEVGIFPATEEGVSFGLEGPPEVGLGKEELVCVCVCVIDGPPFSEEVGPEEVLAVVAGGQVGVLALLPTVGLVVVFMEGLDGMFLEEVVVDLPFCP